MVLAGPYLFSRESKAYYFLGSYSFFLWPSVIVVRFIRGFVPVVL